MVSLQVAAWSHPGWGLPDRPAIFLAARAAWAVRRGQVLQIHREAPYPGLSPGYPVSTALALFVQQQLHPLLPPLVAGDIFSPSCLLSSVPGSGEQRSDRPISASFDQRDSEWCRLCSWVTCPSSLAPNGCRQVSLGPAWAGNSGVGSVFILQNPAPQPSQPMPA